MLPVQGGGRLKLQVPEDVRQRRFDTVIEGEGQSFEAGDIDIVDPLEVQDHPEFALVVLEGNGPDQRAAQPEGAASGECGQEAAGAAIRRSVVAGSQDPDEPGLFLLYCLAVGVRSAQTVQSGEQFTGFGSDIALPHLGADPVLVVPEMAALDGDPGRRPADFGHRGIHEKPPQVVIRGIAGVAVEPEIARHGYTTVSVIVV